MDDGNIWRLDGSVRLGVESYGWCGGELRDKVDLEEVEKSYRLDIEDGDMRSESGSRRREGRRR